MRPLIHALRCAAIVPLTFLLSVRSMAQARLLQPGTEIVVKEISTWDPAYKYKDEIVGKKAVVSDKKLLRVGADHWAGGIQVAGKDYELLDMMIDVRSVASTAPASAPTSAPATPKATTQTASYTSTSATTPVHEATGGKNLKKMELDILQLVEEYKSDFSKVRTSESYQDQYKGTCYKVNCKLEGCDDGEGWSYYDTTAKHWSLNMPIDPHRYSSKDVDKLLMSMNFPFGKLMKEPPIEGSTSRIYIPQNRAKVPAPYNDFSIMVVSYFSNDREIMLALLLEKNKY